MNRAKKILNSLLFVFILVAVAFMGYIIPDTFSSSANTKTATKNIGSGLITNNLPQDGYFTVERTHSNPTDSVSYIGNEIFLMKNSSKISTIIGGNTQQHIVSQQVDETVQKNYAFFPNLENQSAYYYFNFTNSLALYYDITNTDIQNGLNPGTNILESKPISDYTFTFHETISKTNVEIGPFTPNSLGFIPQQLKVNFAINTKNPEATFSENNITLNKEGCYTLVVNGQAYFTDNDGLSYVSSNIKILYTFMLFNSDTYFNGTTGLPNVISSPSIQESIVSASDQYSRYYFYNYAFAGTTSQLLPDSSFVNSLPSFSFNPNLYQISIAYTDVEQNNKKVSILYKNNKFVQTNELGEELKEQDYFVYPTIKTDGDEIIGYVYFKDIGTYDISFQYFCKTSLNGTESIYELPFNDLQFDELESGGTVRVENKNQKLHIYGIQTKYSDYAHKNPLTNQPEMVEFKSFDYENGTTNNEADITSYVNNFTKKNKDTISTSIDEYIASHANSGIDAKGKNNLFKALNDVIPSSSSAFQVNLLKYLSLNYINANHIQPVSTNQTPIKFINNIKILTGDAKPSQVIKLNLNGETYEEIADSNVKFEGFNQNEAGTYLYLIQYNYPHYLSTSGTLQSSFVNYQILFFTVTNTTPTVTVLDDEFNELYASSFTNKGVYILNDSENNIYDAKVDITLSAKNYTNGKYFFLNKNIKDLKSYDIDYQVFNSIDPKVDGKAGIYIDSRSRIANSFFTVKIKTANSSKESSKSFTIDTQEISGMQSRNVRYVSDSNYKIEGNVTQSITNQPIIFSWNEKPSGATTQGYIKYIPLEKINYYSSQTDAIQISELLFSCIVNHDTIPVSYKINLSEEVINNPWTLYSNTISAYDEISSTYVKSNPGIYILEVFDNAGNSSFSINMIDNTEPLFVQTYSQGLDVKSLLINNSTISIQPDANVTMEWTHNKSIFIDNLANYLNIKPYIYTPDFNNAKEKLNNTLDNFFNVDKNQDLHVIDDITTPAINSDGGDSSKVLTGIDSYNGVYLYIPINNVAYIKNTKDKTFKPYTNKTVYQIKFIDEYNAPIEGTYKIILRDKSNTTTSGNEFYDYTNNPSSFISFNVTSDASKLSIQASIDGKNNSLDFSSYDLHGKLFNKGTDQDPIFTHIPYETKEDGSTISYKETNKTYKFSYYTPIKSLNKLTLSYIPFAANGSKIDTITLKYYKYQHNTPEISKDGNTYFHYELEKTPSYDFPIYQYSPDQVLPTGQEESFDIILGSTEKPLPGRYVIERTYVKESNIDDYDYFRRTLTVDVDDFDLISKLETVSNSKGSSLESLVGGDIILSMYSGENQSSLTVTFPKYTAETGLNQGSFRTKDSFKDEIFSSFAVKGNKLPFSLFIPKYKFTTSTSSKIDPRSDKYQYSVDINDQLSYYGNSKIVPVYKDGTQDIPNARPESYDVYIEGLLVTSFKYLSDAQEYLSNKTTISEYEIKVKIEAKLKNGETKFYTSTGESLNNFLYLYEVSNKNASPESNAKPVEYFFEQGKYVVDIYQAYNQGVTSSFYASYRFGFEIISEHPEFDLVNKDGYILSETNRANEYYTNSDEIKVQWTVPTNEHMAKIDQGKIRINTSPAGAEIYKSEIVEQGNVRYFTFRTENISSINITMQFEGYDPKYYHDPLLTKTIRMDKSAPLKTLQQLMVKTETATNKVFSKNYQELFLRRYFDNNNISQTGLNLNQIKNMSYSYSNNQGAMKYYSYNVDMRFFSETLLSLQENAHTDPFETQFIYFKYIPSINSYNQVDKDSFAVNNYTQIESNILETLKDESFYEIVEKDYAGNMTVYVVYLSNDTYTNASGDQEYKNDAFSYVNALNPDPINISRDKFADNTNIYSNSGFKLKSMNYKSDPWNLMFVKIANKYEVRYMKSPWLEEGYIYKITYPATGMEFTPVLINSIFDNVTASNNKHLLAFANRIDGVNIKVYLSIMDATIQTRKITDPTKSSSILEISIPNKEEYNSTKVAYIFPSKISIYTFQNSDWNKKYEASQTSYGIWNTNPNFESDAIVLAQGEVNDRILRITIKHGNNNNAKYKYEITDNFGKVTQVIQLSNEIEYQEIYSNSKYYEMFEKDGSATYLTDKYIEFRTNNLLYNVQILKDGVDVTGTIETNQNAETNIDTYKFKASELLSFWNENYQIIITDNETNAYIKTINIQLYYQLPNFVTTQSEVLVNNGILFNDNNANALTNFTDIGNTTVNFEGQICSDQNAQSFVTYSPSISIYFKNGQELSSSNSHLYENQYPYSVYISNNKGINWIKINSDDSDKNAYEINEFGEYLVLIKYDHETIFTDMCQIFELTMLDSSKSNYTVTVDGIEAKRSSTKYTDPNDAQYEVNYIVSLDYNEIDPDKIIDDGTSDIPNDNRLKIILNPNKKVRCEQVNHIMEENDTYVDIYYYKSEDTEGYFAIIYIKQLNNFVSSFTCETPDGTRNIEYSDSSIIIVPDKENDNDFDKLKLSFTSFYGIQENLINIEVLKLFNNDYVEVFPTVYRQKENSYIYLDRAGSYRIKLYDSSSPANIQQFKNGNYLDVIFLNNVPFIISQTNAETEEVTYSESIQNAVYNEPITISLYNMKSYFKAAGYPYMTAKLNGKPLREDDYEYRNYNYTFSKPGYYSIRFTATSNSGIPIREEEFNFTILNKNESRYAYEFSKYKNYYVSKIFKDDVDITQDLLKVSNFETIQVDGKEYLAELMLNYLDEKSGKGRYKIEIKTNDITYRNTTQGSFTFEFRLNYAVPPLQVSIPEGEKTTKEITVKFNVQNLYDTMGDCYIAIGKQKWVINAETLPTYEPNVTLKIKDDMDYYIQVYSMSDHLLYSYKVTKVAPLNTFAIIAIVFGVAAFIAIVGVTIGLRKRQKVK